MTQRWMVKAMAAMGLAGLSACNSVAPGKLTVSVSGEDVAKAGLPLTEGDETIALADGWSVSFSKFLVSVGRLSVSGVDGEVAAADSKLYVADLHTGDPELLTIDPIAARRWDRFNFFVVPPSADAVALEGVQAADVERMRTGGFNYWIEGSATKGEKTVTFAWGLTNPTSNAECTNGDDEKPGVVVPTGATASAQLTFHVEHLFWTSLGSEGAALRFEPIAAKADANGVIALDALVDQPLAQPRDASGNVINDEAGQPLVYNPGTAAATNLKEFILASMSSAGHLNGEGLCTVTAAP